MSHETCTNQAAEQLFLTLKIKSGIVDSRMFDRSPNVVC